MNNNTCASCPANSSAPAGSTAISQCVCNSGYNWIAANGTCVQCPSGSTYDSTNKTCVCTAGIGYSGVYNATSNTCVENGTYSSTLKAYYDPMNCTNPVAWMDNWNSCSSLAEFGTVCLADRRDHRTYRVRKFADGKCWMIDSLKFGGNYGETDGCVIYNGRGNYSNEWCGGSGVSGCTAGGSYNATKAQEVFSLGYYGHCRAITAADSEDGNAYNNYLYDWVAAMQNTLAYYGSATTFNGTQQGLCPSNWHVPSGGPGGEFEALGNLYGTVATIFWTETSKWNSSNSGYSHNGPLQSQGHTGYYWSSVVPSDNNYSASALQYNTRYDETRTASYAVERTFGLAVRCIKN